MTDKAPELKPCPDFTVVTARLREHIDRNREHSDPAKRRDAYLAQDALNVIEGLRADLHVKVKPLVWTEVKTAQGTCYNADLGYTVVQVNKKPGGWHVNTLDRYFGHTSPDEAKAAVQADYERHILAALEPAPMTSAQAAWQPIETAPKDGTTVLLYTTAKLNGLSVSVTPSMWDDGFGWCGRSANDEAILAKVQPTHWMPLPKPPIAEGESE